MTTTENNDLKNNLIALTETPRFKVEYIDTLNGNYNENYNLLSKEDRDELIAYLRGLIENLEEFNAGSWLIYAKSEGCITREEYTQMVNTYIENT